jgi:hypothetical protein
MCTAFRLSDWRFDAAILLVSIALDATGRSADLPLAPASIAPCHSRIRCWCYCCRRRCFLRPLPISVHRYCRLRRRRRRRVHRYCRLRRRRRRRCRCGLLLRPERVHFVTEETKKVG